MESSPRFLSGQFLLAMPGIGDPRFDKAVIAMCVHDEDGALGIGLGRVIPRLGFHDLLKQLDIPAGEAPNVPIHHGGPVEPQRGWILLGDDPSVADAPAIEFKFIREGLYLSTSPALLRQVLEARPAPRARVLAGYAGWGPGQLDEELAQSAWLLGDVDLDIVFDTPAGAMWETVIRRLGADPSTLTTSHGVH